MNRLLLTSIIGNLALAVCAYFLFSTNSNLNQTKGEQAGVIKTYADTNVKLADQVQKCVGTQKSLIVEHTQQLKDLQNVFASIEAANRTKIEALVRDSGKFQNILLGIKRPEVGASCEARIANIDQMVSAYIGEKNR